MYTPLFGSDWLGIPGFAGDSSEEKHNCADPSLHTVQTLQDMQFHMMRW